MRAIVQRVRSASVMIAGEVVGQIDAGFLVYLGVAAGDTESDVEYLASKIRYLRVFADHEGKMNLDISQVDGAILVVSNFTLYADTSQGRRPAFVGAAPFREAQRLYQLLARRLEQLGAIVRTGRFGELMSVKSENDGPVNIILDSRAPSRP